jgi:hypothetical protein
MPDVTRNCCTAWRMQPHLSHARNSCGWSDSEEKSRDATSLSRPFHRIWSIGHMKYGSSSLA